MSKLQIDTCVLCSIYLPVLLLMLLTDNVDGDGLRVFTVTRITVVDHCPTFHVRFTGWDCDIGSV